MTGILSLRVETQNPDLTRMINKVIQSVDGPNIEVSHADSGLDLLVYDIGEDVEKEFEHVKLLMIKNKDAKLFLTSGNSDPSVLMQAIRIGAKEFFSQPVNMDELREAFQRLHIKSSKRLGEVYTFMGCKGGVGTTSVAVNLAVALKELQQDASVALVDMNLVFGDIPLFLNFKHKYTWVEIAKHINRMDDVFLSDNLFEHSSGIHVLPSPSGLNGTEGVTPQIFIRILSHMRRLFDYILIDTGHSFSEINMKTLENSSRVFLVSLLSLPCLSNTTKILSAFDVCGFPSRQNTHVIINRYIPHSEISIQDCEQSINKKVFWKFPNDYAMTMSAINQGLPLSKVDGKSAITKSFHALAQELVPPDSGQSVRAAKPFNKLSRLTSIFRGAHS